VAHRDDRSGKDPDDDVIPSCGCVFCDLALVPQMIESKPMHPVDQLGQFVPCTHKDKS
jgi:hypothetical protein